MAPSIVFKRHFSLQLFKSKLSCKRSPDRNLRVHSDEKLWQHFQWYGYRFQCFCLRFKRLLRPCINFVIIRCHNTQWKIQFPILDTLTKSLHPLIYILACCLITHTHFSISQCFLLQFLLADVYRFQDCIKPGSTCYGTYVRAIQVYHKGHNIYPYITLFTHVLINLCKVRTRATQVQGQATCGDSCRSVWFFSTFGENFLFIYLFI